MANVNKVLLIGRLTGDPELKYLPSGTAVVSANLAINRFIPGKDGAEGRQEVCFVPITIWGKTAEATAQYCSKGKEVFIEGHLQLDQWEDKASGQKRSKMKVVAEHVQFLGGKGDVAPKEESDAVKTVNDPNEGPLDSGPDISF